MLLKYIDNIIFYLSLTDILNIRICNSEFKTKLEDILRKYFKNNLITVYPCRGMVNIQKCNFCKLNKNNTTLIHFNQDTHPNRVFVVCKNNWKCILNAIILRSYISVLGDNAVYTLKPLVKFGEKIIIPRSDGTKTIANLFSSKILLLDRFNIKISTFWYDNNIRYNKLVNLSETKLQAKKISYKKLLILKRLEIKLNSDIISEIKKFLSHPAKITPIYINWKLISGYEYNPVTDWIDLLRYKHLDFH